MSLAKLMSPFSVRFCVVPVLAVALLPKYAATQTAGLEQQYAEAQRALAEGRYSDAEEAFERLRESNPAVAEIHANLGLVYFQEKKFDQAIPELRQALKLKPSLANSAALLAMSLSELGHYAEAVPGLEK